MKFHSLLLGFLLATLVDADANNCTINTSIGCNACVSNLACGWCANLKECHPGLVAGASNGKCGADNWMYGTCKATASNVARNIGIAFGALLIPGLILFFYCWHKKKKLRNRRLRQEEHEEFDLGMTSLKDKYGRMIKGKILDPASQAIKSSTTSNAKQGFQKI